MLRIFSIHPSAWKKNSANFAITEFFGPWDPFFPTFFEEQLAPDPTVGG
jgi:hypothetical protein